MFFLKFNIYINLLVLFWTFSLFLCLAVILFSVIIGGEYLYSEESNSMFECGYDCDLDSRIPFSLRFFLVIILFIVFDMEILVLLPVSIISYWHYYDILSVYLLFILRLIYFSLLYE